MEDLFSNVDLDLDLMGGDSANNLDFLSEHLFNFIDEDLKDIENGAIPDIESLINFDEDDQFPDDEIQWNFDLDTTDFFKNTAQEYQQQQQAIKFESEQSAVQAKPAKQSNKSNQSTAKTTASLSTNRTNRATNRRSTSRSRRATSIRRTWSLRRPPATRRRTVRSPRTPPTRVGGRRPLERQQRLSRLVPRPTTPATMATTTWSVTRSPSCPWTSWTSSAAAGFLRLRCVVGEHVRPLEQLRRFRERTERAERGERCAVHSAATETDRQAAENEIEGHLAPSEQTEKLQDHQERDAAEEARQSSG